MRATARLPCRAVACGLLAAGALVLGACADQSGPAGPDPAAQRAALQQHTERLLWIHYRLDTALTELAKAEELAGQGNPSGAGYHLAEAYRQIEAADDAVLEQGQALQQRFNLDAASANRE